MTKQEALSAIKYFSDDLPKQALISIKANREDFIPELIDSIDYAYNNISELYDDGNDYFMYNYAIYLLAEFRTKEAFPSLVNLLRLPQDEIDFILGDGIVEDFPNVLVSTMDIKNIQMLHDIIEDQELYEWARLSAIITYEHCLKEGIISVEDGVAYLRNLIYNKLQPDDSELVFTGIAGCVIDAKLFDMIPDVRFLHDNDRVDEMTHGAYDGFIDWLFHEKPSKPPYIEDAISEIERWACFKSDDIVKPKPKNTNTGDFFKELEKTMPGRKPPKEQFNKTGRNDPCPCGSGQKYKRCCLTAQQNNTSPPSIEDSYGLLHMYPTDSPLFNQMYEKGAIDIDILAYKALRHRTIPIWIERDLENERLGQIDYLDEALTLFLNKCQQEGITSFSAYDKQFMIHYKSSEWVLALSILIEDNDSEKLALIKQKAEDVLQKFS